MRERESECVLGKGAGNPFQVTTTIGREKDLPRPVETRQKVDLASPRTLSTAEREIM